MFVGKTFFFIFFLQVLFLQGKSQGSDPEDIGALGLCPGFWNSGQGSEAAHRLIQ